MHQAYAIEYRMSTLKCSSAIALAVSGRVRRADQCTGKTEDGAGGTPAVRRRADRRRPVAQASRRPWRVTGNSSVYRFQLGAHADLLEWFRGHFEEVRQVHRNEQAYLSDYLHKQGRLTYWPDQWCASWKYHCIPRFPRNYWRDPAIPQGARILIFHGVMNPPDALAGERNGNWRYAKPAPWIAEHWHA